MPARIEEITATIVDERFRFGEGDEPTVILDATGAGEGSAAPCRFALKGKAENGDPAKHMTYRFYGRWTSYTNQRTGDTERQFHFKTFVKATPLGRAGVIKYLTAAPGVGPSIARQLWEKFESNAVKILREQPDVASAAVERLSLAVAQTAAAYLEHEKALEDCTIAVIDLLEGRGFPKSVAKKAISEFGNRAADIIRQNPYLLMRFRGCGFKRADALYLDLGLPPVKLKRQALCAWHHLARNTDGHTWHYQQVVDVGLKQSIGGAEVQVGKAVQLATRSGMLCAMRTDGVNGPPDWDGDAVWLAEGRKARNEWRLAEYVREAMRDSAEWPEDDGEVRSQLTEHQWDRLCDALSGPLAILGGGPGTGKTFTAAKLIGHLGRQIGWDQIAVMAPTGKAAVRITEAMNQYGLPLRAKTIHSTLKVQQADNDGWAFEHDRGNPLPFRVLIADECFPPGTQIDCPSGPRAIESLCPGDRIFNAIGIDHVRRIAKKEVDRVVKITCGKTTIYTSPNHRFFTTYGFVRADELTTGCPLIQTAEAMRLLWGSDPSFPFESRHKKILQHFLLDEMVDELSGIPAKSLYGREIQESRRGKKGFSGGRQRRSDDPNRSDSSSLSNGQSRSPSQAVDVTEGNGPCPQNQGREWSRSTCTAIGNVHSASKLQYDGLGVGNGDCDEGNSSESQMGETANTLQSGHWKQVFTALHRVRRPVTSLHEGEAGRSKKGRLLSLDRVSRVEVLERSDPELDQFRDADGCLYFYDIAAKRHQTFSVDGLLVHNCSMIDTDLAANLFAARARGTLVLLVGDVGQLPPVGHGAPLRDLIAAGVPYGELSEIRRNSGQIVEACGLIRQGRNFDCGGNLLHVACNGASSQIAAMLATLKEQHTEHGLDPVWDCQVLVPVNKKSELARKTLNEILQAHLNPNEPVRGNPFRVGDKVVNTKNGWFPLVPGSEGSLGEDAEQNADGKVYAANGEIGRVVRNEANFMHVALQSPDRLIVVPRGQSDDSQEGDDEEASGTGCNWDLGYALSVHKMQGSEVPVAIVMIDEAGSAARLCDRAWWYTALSRAKQRCYLVGKMQVLFNGLRRQSVGARKTFLRELITCHSAQNL